MTIEDQLIYRYRMKDSRRTWRLYELADRRDFEQMYAIESVRANMTFPVGHVWYMLLRGYLYIDSLGDFKVRA
jgi:hypothetical protein